MIRDDQLTESYLIDEIRLNRVAIEKVDDKLSGKVGRTELFGWIASSLGATGLALRLLIR